MCTYKHTQTLMHTHADTHTHIYKHPHRAQEKVTSIIIPICITDPLKFRTILDFIFKQYLTRNDTKFWPNICSNHLIYINFYSLKY